MRTWSEYLVDLHREKDLAYGDAWCRRGEVAGIFPNIARKYDRWIRIHDRSTTVMQGVEPLEDTLADLLIYSVKYLLWLVERYPEVVPPLPTDISQLSVEHALTLVSQAAVIDDSADFVTSAFEELESLMASQASEADTAEARMKAAWLLALGSWAHLHLLPVPTADGEILELSPMRSDDSVQTARALLDQLLRSVTKSPGSILILGCTPAALELRAELVALGLGGRLLGIAHPGLTADDTLSLVEWASLDHMNIDYLVVASDEHKESLLRSFTTEVQLPAHLPQVILTGIAHLTFQDELYTELDAPALVPSYATGYPFTRIHMYQHLRAAAENGLSGAIVEFGAFKGGTTAWLARAAHRLGLDVPILAFDSWDGFPPPRSVLDMYSHSRCVFSDLSAVRAYLEPLGIEIVAGDISDTAPARLNDVPILLAFVDTDNYSPARSALSAIVDNVVPGGAIVFDHFTTTEEYVYTLGERMAGASILRDRGFYHVHGSGVFVRLPDLSNPNQPSGSRPDRPSHGT